VKRTLVYRSRDECPASALPSKREGRMAKARVIASSDHGLALVAFWLFAACGRSAAPPATMSLPTAAPPSVAASAGQAPPKYTSNQPDECSSSLDCARPARCCSNGVEAVNRCISDCQDHEACVPTASNSCHAGSRCQPDSSSHSGGACRVAAPSVDCGSQRCSGDRPACHWQRAARHGACVAVGPAGGWTEELAHGLSEGSVFLECSSPKDCAGERCCASGPMPVTACSGGCTSGIDVCDTVADCPNFLGPPTGCAADAEGPPFLKTCRYEAAR
jgi:hypothetical protein